MTTHTGPVVVAVDGPVTVGQELEASGRTRQ